MSKVCPSVLPGAPIWLIKTESDNLYPLVPRASCLFDIGKAKSPGNEVEPIPNISKDASLK